ncbi:hypothetical protein NDU88_003226 [Pleurodeles waltl]|uniref:Uncharacterized protein n=1 Tax=Pleurodeles waltl TaxID=8319 RepID=A0AAV7V017_PLEWA|nr:hypothetical protein NDU88_003226 [Pleurodeles waltl]
MRVKRKPRQTGLRYLLFFPAKLKFMVGRPFFFYRSRRCLGLGGQRCYETATLTLPMPQRKSAHSSRKRNYGSHAAAAVQVCGGPTPEQSKEEQAQALTDTTNLWVERRSPLQEMGLLK